LFVVDTTYSTGTVNIIVDGTGTLITPDGDTIHNAMRVTLNTVEADSTDLSYGFGYPPGSYYQINYSQSVGYSYTTGNGAQANVSINYTSGSVYTDSLGYITTVNVANYATLDYSVPTAPVTAVTNAVTAYTGIVVYPNPAKDLVTINLNGTACTTAQLTDITGREVLSSTDGTITINGPTVTMNVNGLSKGIYLVQLSGGSAPATQRVVVE